jgi:hypothetical protein
MHIKNYVLFLFTVLATAVVHAQGWERAYPTLSPSTEATALKSLPDPDGNGFLVLMTDLEFDEGNFYLVSTDDTGGVQAVKTFDFGGAEIGVDFLATSDGGFALLYDVFYDPLDTIASHLLKVDAAYNVVFDLSLNTVASAAFYRAQRVLENSNGLFVFGVNRTPDGIESATTLHITAAGAWVGQLDWGAPQSPVVDAIVATDGTLIGLTDQPGQALGSGDRIRVTRLDDAGAVVLWEKLLADVPNWERAGAVTTALDGNLVVSGSRTGDAVLYKLDLQGNILWENATPNGGAVWGVFDLVARPDGGYWAVGQTPMFIPQIYLMRFDAAGALVRSNVVGPWLHYNYPFDLLELPDNGVLITGSTTDAQASPQPQDPHLWRADAQGRTFPTGLSGSLLVDLDGDCAGDSDSLGYGPWYIKVWQNGVQVDSVWLNYPQVFFDLPLPAGDYRVTVDAPSNAWSVCPDTLDVTVVAGDIADDQNFTVFYDPQAIDTIYGSVFIDYDGDCEHDAFESGLAAIDVQFLLGQPALPTGPIFTLNLTTAGDGSFSSTNTGGMTDLIESLAILPPPSPANPQQCSQVCKKIDYIVLPDGSRVYSVQFGVLCEPLPPCPVLETEIATAVLRPCFPTYYSVQICNYGAEPAEDATVDITFDAALQITGASIPWTSVDGSTYTFDLDTLVTGECVNFTVDVFVPCDELVGQTYCAEAHAYPDTPCDDTSAIWDQSEIAVMAECLDTTVRFVIKNVGTGPMAAPLEYIVIEDNVLLMMQPGMFQLGPGEELPLEYQPAGAFLRLEADQSPGFPGLSLPVAWVEGCGSGSGAPAHYGFVNQYPVDDPEPWLDVFCLQSVNSYDPNDKTGFPLGYGAERYIEPGQPLEYMIRFQNTGTAPAVNVAIRDTLPWLLLDPGTVRPGPSSHPYTFDIEGNGIVVFKFANINLPDSVSNEPGSHGFVTFTIEQQPNLPVQTEIRNSAAIYFDFNEPVITNHTLHTLGVNFILVEVEQPTPAVPVQVTAAPNPAMDRVRFATMGLEPGRELTVTLFSSLGYAVRRQSGTAPVLELPVQDLAGGAYWFEIRQDGRVISKGKLIKVAP